MRLVDPDKYKRLTTHVTIVLVAMLTMLSYSILAFGQKPEYEFYFDFRKEFSPTLQEKNHWSLTNEQVFEKYAE